MRPAKRRKSSRVLAEAVGFLFKGGEAGEGALGRRGVQRGLLP